MGITEIKERYSGTTNSKIATRWWRVTLVPVGPQAEMMSSLTKCRLWSCRTIMSLVEEVGISTGLVHSVLTDDLAMRSVSAKFMPKLLMMEQKQLHLEVSQDMLDYAN
jgi:hypothetical protein